MKKLILGAIFLRLLVMPFLFHPDIKVYSFQASHLKQGVWNIYEREEFVYQPLTYLFLGSYQTLIQSLARGLNNWLADSSGGAITNPSLYWYLILLKLPILIFDLLVGFLLYKLMGKKALTLWLFNPLTIVLLYVFSNVDIFPLFFVLLSCLFYKKDKNLLSAIALGVGAGFKMYPLLLLPFFLISQKDWRRMIIYLAGALGTFFLILMPFMGPAMLQSSLVSGLSTRIFQGQISLGFGESLYPAVIGLVVIYLLAYLKKDIPMENWIVILLLTLFSFIHFHIQWLMWGAPFVLMVWLKNEKIKPLLLVAILLAFSIPLMYNDKFMGASLFTPISSLFSLIPTPFAVVQKVFDPYVIQGVLHSALVGITIMLGYKLLKDEQH
ncbi:hypothetical protein A2188_00320 [Candidatus Woesebacteria bacterium RIFOXYA1_FULL_43_9]|uniref:DUF2029 domain-containing protein n=1 Tax=Candidatus Woesebacteria bacterium RIFOXYA1_FULL_43_9 TaxID=1802534 RepID=A0A1F8CJ95_9BACT|nr:MAG: hypothetical protein A2188_00320 [Candidatus Woesebacteria bacterium RIFOXYA1_FULL_43_9]